jgi:hypothetical protein
MFATMEVRWFYEGIVSPEVREWFQQSGQEPEEQPVRIDYYLCLPNADFLGIKLREGRVEIKQRHRQHGVIHFHKRIAGMVEHWRKWSFELAEVNDGLSNMVTPASSWIGVSKERKLRRYRMTANQVAVAVTAEEHRDQGCDLELTTISVGGKDWWSLGFEAFGSEAILQETLLLVAKQVLAVGEPPILDVRDSCSYPKWLAMITQGGEP